MATDYTRYPTDLLPLPQLAGYGYKRNSGTVRIPMVSGRTRNRRKWSNAPGELPSVTFRFSSAELALFEGWFEDILHGGSAQFTMPVKTAIGISDHLCKFLEDLEPTALAPDRWEVKFRVEVEALAKIDENETISRYEGIDDAATALETGLDEAVTDYVTPESN